MKKKFQRSDIPYKDRLLMQRHDNIRDHRDEAARVAMQLGFIVRDGHMIALEGPDGAVNATKYLAGDLANPEVTPNA